MMEEIIRQSLCPKFLFKEGNKKLTEVPPQCNLWDARHLTCCGDLQWQYEFMFRNHLKSSNLLLHLFKSYSSTNIICAKPCRWPLSNVWCLVCIGQTKPLCPMYTEVICWNVGVLSRERFIARAKQGIRMLVLRRLELPSGFQGRFFKGRLGERVESTWFSSCSILCLMLRSTVMQQGLSS